MTGHGLLKQLRAVLAAQGNLALKAVCVLLAGVAGSRRFVKAWLAGLGAVGMVATIGFNLLGCTTIWVNVTLSLKKRERNVVQFICINNTYNKYE
jgi:threonine dehydrogenase-like Zn-dependent dehydrogenase